jgi:Tfp pilus assembly protein PilX
MRLFKLSLSDDRGIALPVALAVLFAVAGLATVAARAAIVADHQSFRDRNAKSAIESAQSGLQAATHELNMLQPGLSSCVAKNAGTGDLSIVTVPASGWCATETETLGDGASYTVQVSGGTHLTVNGQNIDERKVVATGTTNGVIRRATYTIDAATGNSLFPKGYGMVGKDTVEFKNNTTFTNGGIGSNGDIIFKNNTDVCGPVVYGPGGSFTAGGSFSQCAGFPPPGASSQPFPLQPVDMTGPNASNNNVYITRAVGTPPQPTPKDSCSNCGSISWNSSTRALSLGGNSVLTLTGDVYALCSLTLGNSAQLQIAARTTPMIMYIDSPNTCGAGTGSVTLDGQFVNVNASASSFVLEVAGSTTTATTVGISDNSSHASSPMAIYAPNSTVDFKNNLDWKGAIVAKTIKVKNNATIDYDSSIEIILSGSQTRLYESQGYKECATVPSSSTDPSSGC